MITLDINLGERSYPVYIDNATLSRADLIRRHIVAHQVMVVTNETVAPLYLQQVKCCLQGLDVNELILPDGEKYKNIAVWQLIIDAMLTKRFNRHCTLIALGGGVIGDMVGFAAACYQRGVAFMQIPTTLLAQVDASVGGKTGVNHPLGKNMIGAFHQPRCVIIDTDTLKTLPDRELAAGCAEIIKYGLIRDEKFFVWLEANILRLLARDSITLAYAIEQSCFNKAAVVIADERETDTRALLNLGHTFGHAIETGLGYGEWLHGEAVAAGICMAAELSWRLGWLAGEAKNRIIKLIAQCRLPTTPPLILTKDRFEALMMVDKKVLDSGLRLVLLTDIGKAIVTNNFDSLHLSRMLNEYSPIPV